MNSQGHTFEGFSGLEIRAAGTWCWPVRCVPLRCEVVVVRFLSFLAILNVRRFEREKRRRMTQDGKAEEEVKSVRKIVRIYFPRFLGAGNINFPFGKDSKYLFTLKSSRSAACIAISVVGKYRDKLTWFIYSQSYLLLPRCRIH